MPTKGQKALNQRKATMATGNNSGSRLKYESTELSDQRRKMIEKRKSSIAVREDNPARDGISLPQARPILATSRGSANLAANRDNLKPNSKSARQSK